MVGNHQGNSLIRKLPALAFMDEVAGASHPAIGSHVGYQCGLVVAPGVQCTTILLSAGANAEERIVNPPKLAVRNYVFAVH